MTSQHRMEFELRPVMRPWHHVAFLVLSSLLGLAILRFGFYWARVPEWATRPGEMVLLTLILLLFVAQYLQSWTTMPAMRRPTPPVPEPGRRVALATTFVPGAESLEMLDLTLSAMKAVSYPHDTWVLDEGNDPAVIELCGRHAALHFTRRERPELSEESGRLAARTKYGNINAWLQTEGFSRYDVVAFFDPDHVPEPDFLERSLGYLRDPTVAFVQGAQIYYNQDASFIARGAAEESYSYYSSTLMAAFGLGHTVMVGCHNVHRVSALEEIGGLSPHDADDLLTALHYHRHGWEGVYVPEVLAAGLTPVGWPAYLTQQRRWARSVVDIKLRHLPRLWRHLSRSSRMFALLQGASYPIDVAVPVIGTVLLTWILLTGQTSILSRLFGHQLLLLLLAIAGLNVFRQLFFLEPERERGLHWRAGLLRAAKWPFIAWGIAEGLVGARRTYEITDKGGATPRGAHMLALHLWIGLIVGAAYAWALAAHQVAYWSLHVWGLLIPLLSFGIFAAGFWRPPPAFERSIWSRWKRGHEARGARASSASE